jgi:dsRNA-specific ribonuclease
MDRRKQLLEQAWLGDAVLSLYVRSKILREEQVLDGEKCARMTSNRFLGAIGEPTEVEAQIGRLFISGGLDEAYSWIDEHLGPALERQERKHLKLPRSRPQV